jgi:hypothetical protein
VSKIDGTDDSRWVTGEFSFWLIEYSPDRPIILFLRSAENLNIRFYGDEWGELFYGVLKCPTFHEVSEAQSNEPAQVNYYDALREFLFEYPMLRELSEIYSKVLFQLENIPKLRTEVLELMPKAENNEIALRGLEKLKNGCDKALEKNKLLYLN